MASLLGSLRKLVLGISPEECSFARRGFRGGVGGAREHLEKIPLAFAAGYHAVLEDSRREEFVPKLEAIGPEHRGFAYEGAGMALALLDYFTPWRRERVRTFLQGAGDAHTYMVHVSVGWVVARMHGKMESVLARLDPLLCWLVMDGYGFHEGFFHWPRYIAGQPAPARFQGYACRAFDQGLGRSLWFIEGADVGRIPQTIAALPLPRRSDLWSGVGLACVYAGGVDGRDLEKLREAAGPFRAHLAQGAAFAAKARQRAGNVTAHTRLATEIICGVTVEAAARITDQALEDLPVQGSEPAYEVWRRRVQARLAPSG